MNTYFKKGQTLKRGEVYYVDLGENIGSEVNKIRPCLVIQNDIGNKYSPTTIVLPISHKKLKKIHPTQIILKRWMQEKTYNLIDGVIMAEQIRVIDKRRIQNLVGVLSFKAMKLVDRIISISVGMSTGIKKSA